VDGLGEVHVRNARRKTEGCTFMKLSVEVCTVQVMDRARPSRTRNKVNRKDLEPLTANEQ
jgi:hypothetical protein